ncbi:MAG: hypothetical protein KME22_30035 [Hassallia sp. WJT32-NPBG1]|nr:hypothetical protein [Hassallia sp. WJT32-NPBG1]
MLTANACFGSGIIPSTDRESAISVLSLHSINLGLTYSGLQVNEVQRFGLQTR